MIRTFALLLALSFSTRGAGQDCEGSATQLLLTCTPQNCSEGCKKMRVDTHAGPNTGEVCICNYVGPQPFCCKVMRSVVTGALSTWGACASPGCPPAPGRCSVEFPPPGGDDYGSQCLNIPGGGDPVPD